MPDVYLPREQERGERKDKDVRGRPGTAWGFLGRGVVWGRGWTAPKLSLSQGEASHGTWWRRLTGGGAGTVQQRARERAGPCLGFPPAPYPTGLGWSSRALGLGRFSWDAVGARVLLARLGS